MYSSYSELLKDDWCWVGHWDSVKEKTCNVTNCNWCNDIPGYCMIPCIKCNNRTSQCLLHYLTDCRTLSVEEIWNRALVGMGYPASAVCIRCYPTLIKHIIDVKINNIPIGKSIKEPLKKYLVDHWDSLQE